MYGKWDICCGIYSIGKNPIKHFAAMKMRGKRHKLYNYYPRGRVEITGGEKPVIYLNPHIGAEHIPEIRRQLGIDNEPKVHYDGSRHCKCYLDTD